MPDVIQRVETQFVSTGAEKVTADYQRLANAEKAITDAVQRGAEVSERLEKSRLDQSRRIDRYINSNDQLAKALSEVVKGETLLARARADGVKNIADLERAYANAQARHQALNRAALDGERAMAKYGAGAGLARHEIINLSRQVQDVGVSLAGGQNPLMVLIQQGSQIADVFATSKASIGDVFKQGAAWAGRFAVSVGGISTALAGVAAGVTYSAMSFNSTQRQIDLAISGRGRGSGLSRDEITNTAERVGKTGDLSFYEAQSIATKYASTGKIAPDLVEGLTRATRPLSLLTNGKVDEAGAMLAEAFSDPAKGAEALNAKLGGVNAEMMTYIKRAQEAGDLAGAQRRLFDAMGAGLESARGKESAWSRGVRSVESWIGNADYRVGKAIGGAPTLDQQLQAAWGNLDAHTQAAKNGMGSEGIGPAFKQIETLQRQIATRDAKVKADADAMRLSDASPHVRAIVASLTDDATKLDSAKTRWQALKDTLLDSSGALKPDALKAVGIGAAQANEALEKAKQGFTGFKTVLAQAAEDGRLQIAQINAVSAAQRAAVDGQRAYAEAIRATADKSLAAVQAENARNRVIAEANRQAQEALLGAKMDARLVGLSPYQRGLQQIENEREMARRAMGSASQGVAPAATSTGGAASDSATALRNARGLTDDFQQRLGALFAAFPGLSITSGFRSTEQQARLYAEKPGWAAPPGRSNHERGMAADLALNGKWSWDEIHAAAEQYGIRFPMKDRTVRPEPWHAEPIKNWRGSTDVAASSSPSLRLQTGDVDKTFDTKRDSYLREAQIGPIMSAEQSLRGQVQAYQILRGAVAETAEKQGYLAEKARLFAEYAQQGIAPSEEIKQRIEGQAAAAGRLAAQQDRDRKMIAGFDDMRSMTSDMIGGPLKAIASGAKPQDAFKQAASQLGGKLIDMGTKSLTEMLWGPNGSVGRGALGNPLASFMKGAGGDNKTMAATADIEAAVVNLSGPLSGIGGGAAGGASGGGGILGAIAKLFSGGGGAGTTGTYIPFAAGGIMSPFGPLPLRKYSAGGVANSPQMAIYGEGSHNEAYVPLPDGRTIPVTMQGKGGQSSGGAMNFRGGDMHVTVQGNADEAAMAQLRTYVDASNTKLGNDMARNMGTIMSQHARRYG